MSVKTFTGSNIRRNIVGCAENCRVVVVRLGKIKCAANWVGLWVALQPFLFCEGIAKRLCRNLHCRSVYVCRLMVALSGLRVADNSFIGLLKSVVCTIFRVNRPVKVSFLF